MYFNRGNIYLSRQEHLNIVRYDNVDYILASLDESYDKSKGGNSCVFRLIEAQTKTEFIIKFSKYDISRPNYPVNNIRRITRFLREIEALKIAKDAGFQNVIQYNFDGRKRIGKGMFHFYVMERADYDLTKYLDTNEVSDQQRFLLCIQILKGIKELHSRDIYHRDIKPDNILFVDNVWKIGDLGLVDNRNTDFTLKEVGEKIGPVGWLSPEAANKYLNEGDGKLNRFNLDCVIDEKSDIFQLGKLFWYIFQGNIPIGQLKASDFKLNDKEIFKILCSMLSHCKERPSLDEVEAGFESRFGSYAI